MRLAIAAAAAALLLIAPSRAPAAPWFAVPQDAAAVAWLDVAALRALPRNADFIDAAARSDARLLREHVAAWDGWSRATSDALRDLPSEPDALGGWLREPPTRFVLGEFIPGREATGALLLRGDWDLLELGVDLAREGFAFQELLDGGGVLLGAPGKDEWWALCPPGEVIVSPTEAGLRATLAAREPASQPAESPAPALAPALGELAAAPAGAATSLPAEARAALSALAKAPPAELAAVPNAVAATAALARAEWVAVALEGTDARAALGFPGEAEARQSAEALTQAVQSVGLILQLAAHSDAPMQRALQPVASARFLPAGAGVQARVAIREELLEHAREALAKSGEGKR